MHDGASFGTRRSGPEAPAVVVRQKSIRVSEPPSGGGEVMTSRASRI